MNTFSPGISPNNCHFTQLQSINLTQIKFQSFLSTTVHVHHIDRKNCMKEEALPQRLNCAAYCVCYTYK